MAFPLAFWIGPTGRLLVYILPSGNLPVDIRRNRLWFSSSTPYRLLDHLKSFPDYEDVKARWKDYWNSNPGEDLSSDDWDRAYLPSDEENQRDVPLPRIPIAVGHNTNHAENCRPAQSVHDLLDGPIMDVRSG